jgi:hypothetical protein
VEGLSAMFDADVVMPAGPKLVRGKADAMAALRANPANLASRATWTPVRGGISADGRHGFTYGYTTTEEAGKPKRHGKYLAYWVKRSAGWRVAAYRRVPRPEGEVSLAPMAPALPRRLVAPVTDEAAVAKYRQSLDRAERAFSDRAQVIGLGPAFAENGSKDAMNMGQGPSFTIGAENIGRMLAQGPQVPLAWAPDGVLVASSGDLGVTWGTIRRAETAPAGEPAAFPFFTIWRRADAGDRWLYVAE